MFDNREKLENLAICGPWGHNFDISEKLTEKFRNLFDELSNVYSRFSLRPIGAEIDGGVHLRPSRWWKIWSARGVRVNPRPAGGGGKGPPVVFRK